jgi:hypothetical protein
MTDRMGYVLPEDRDYSTTKEVDRVMQDMPLLTACGRPIAGTGEGKIARLDKLLEQVAGYYPVVRQTIGDCVSFGWAKGIMATLAADIVVRGESEEWPGNEICTEWIYGTSRVLVGRGRLGNSDGSIGAWAARAVTDHGTLLRKQYGSHDLRRYSGKRAKSWGFRGLPANELEPTADEHPVSRKPALVTSFEEARDAIANGYAVPVCSNQGLSRTRDRDGFTKASGRWAHCMCFVGSRDDDRPGLLIDNSSWGDWIGGSNPDKAGGPCSTGCAWLDASTCDRMLRQNDSFAVPGYDGFAARSIEWSLW